MALVSEPTQLNPQMEKKKKARKQADQKYYKK